MRLKSGRDRGGLVEDITYTDLTMRDVGEPIIVTSYYYGLPKHGVRDAAQPVTAKTPHWRHIVIRNITAENCTKDAGLIMGLPESPIQDITLDHVRITAPKGLRIGWADGVALKHVNIHVDEGDPVIIEDTVQDLSH